MTDFITNLTLAFNNTANCIESNNKNVFWIDENPLTSKSFIVQHLVNNDEKDIMIRINNPLTKDINLLCIDACIFSSSDGSRCDCAIFDDNKFCFCELKFEVIKSDNATSNLKKARNKQLNSTITEFKSKVDFSRFSKLEAYVALKKYYYPKRPARLAGLKTDFWNQHQVEYFEEKEITFDVPEKKIETD